MDDGERGGVEGVRVGMQVSQRGVQRGERVEDWAAHIMTDASYSPISNDLPVLQHDEQRTLPLHEHRLAYGISFRSSGLGSKR